MSAPATWKMLTITKKGLTPVSLKLVVGNKRQAKSIVRCLKLNVPEAASYLSFEYEDNSKEQLG